MMGKWTLEQVTSESGEKFHELRRDGVICMLLPQGGLQTGWEGGDLKRFLGILNAHELMLNALEEIAKGEGAFSRDPLEHAANTIEHMVDVAKDALASGKAVHRDR